MSRLWPIGLAMTAVTFAQPARAECLGGGCYDGLVLVLLLAALGVVAVIGLIIFLMVKSGLGWLVKWLIGAGVLIGAVPPLVLGMVHDRKVAKIDALDFAGPLPRMADRTPLFVLYSADSNGCSSALDLYIAARSFDGLLILETWSDEDVIDYSKPVSLADLPLVRKVTTLRTVPDDQTVGGSYQIQDTVNQPLSAAERKSAAAEVDYLVFAQCRGSGRIFQAFQLNPALQGTSETYSVELAMASLAKGSGLLSLPDLKFDLLDLRYDGTTEGFLFAPSRQGDTNQEPYDIGALEEAFCMENDWAPEVDCDP